MILRAILSIFFVFLFHTYGYASSCEYQFVTKWGSFGPGDWQFDNPIAITADASGNIYVVDTRNHRIQKFTSDGAFLTKWGSYGSGDGQFNLPSYVATDAFDNVFVADTLNNRIQEFSPDGVFIRKWGSFGTGDGQFENPAGVSADSTENVYVSDTGNNRIQKFTADGTFLTKWGSYGTGDGQFDSPTGITADTSGNVYIAGFQNHRIQKFTADGAFLMKWGSYGIEDGLFVNPFGVAKDKAGNFYVADQGNHRIQKFIADGVFLSKWGSYGSGDGQFDLPTDVAVGPAGNIYVADKRNHRIQKFQGFHTFSDITTEFSWAEDYISSISCAGISTGYGDGTYQPINTVNRAEMAVFIIRALGEVPEDGYCGTTNPFPDVSSGHWACKYIKRLSELGISSGNNGLYYPTELVNRAQMAVYVIRALEGNPPDNYCSGVGPFSDVASSHWACDHIKRLFELNISNGYPDNTYKPANTVNRAQMAVYISRAFLGMP